MGGSSSTSGGRNSYYQNRPPPQQPCYYPPPPPPPQSYGYSTTHYPPHPPPGPNYNFPGWYSPSNPPTGYYGGQSSGMGNQTRAPAQPPPPPPHYAHQSTKKIKNDVNVHKDSIKLEIDELNPDQYLVSFVLDALFDGSITIYYFAKEEENCKLTPLRPELFKPVTMPFQKGMHQKFRQPFGTGIDLGFFESDELAKPSPDDREFPLVISAKVYSTSNGTGDEDANPAHSSPSLQITQAVIETNEKGPFQVKVIKQILWIDNARYELREIYGISNQSAKDFTDDDSGKECVICMTEPKDTAVMPCRHMCMCSECAKELRLQTNKCPICRQPITELIEIKLDDDNQ